MRVKASRFRRLLALTLSAVILNSCQASRNNVATAMTGGDPNRGAASIEYYGCGACHNIHGIVGAVGQVGPSMQGLKNRTFIAGFLPNQPANLIRWVEDPRSVKQNTAMPTLGVTPNDAVNIAAYLYAQQ